jgi:hypothetical protein
MLLAGSARASDGVLEINHTCAVQTGCFAGDTPGYPVTIDRSLGRSLRLTSNLILPDAATTGILIAASYVALDLNGFSIIRAACVNTESSCRPAISTGTGIAVQSQSPGFQGISVRNGSIIGMGSEGVYVGERSELRDLQVRWCGRHGALVATGSIVSGVRAYENGQHGIFLNGAGTRAEGNTAHQNLGHGIYAGFGATLSGNAAYDNAFVGINLADGSSLSNSASYRNGQQGILATDGSTLTDNAVYDNRNTGIACGANCVISSNSVRTNASGGISAGYLAHVVDNSLDGNAGPQISVSDGSTVSRNTVGAITPQFVGYPGIQCGPGCAVFENLVRNGSQGMSLGEASRYGRNVLSLVPSPAVSGGVSAGDNLCNGTGC